MKHLQRLLVTSRSAKMVAIRDVTERSTGRCTPGVDGKVYLTTESREEMSHERFDYRTHKPQPVRRVYIPKPSGRKRPLGIPTIKDRIMQAIVKMAQEPEWEAKFAADSYGFRPGRCCQDAVEAIRQAVHAMKARGFEACVLEADIASCFDRIAQGGVISPLLANVALDGIEGLFTGKWWARVVRYADDFVVVAATKRIAERTIRPAVVRFLAARGLELNPEKTGVVELPEGFNFLGFTFRTYDGVLLITPQKEKVQRILQHLKAILVANRQTRHRDLIILLNPAIRGWTNYYRSCNASKSFNRVDYHLFWKLWRWARRRHPGKPREWVRQKYFQGTNERHWAFGEKGGLQLHSAASTRVLHYRKVYGVASPFDVNLRSYWKERARYVVDTS